MKEQNNILIYTPEISNRLRYIFKLFFNDLLGVAHELTSDQEQFSQCQDAKFSYAGKPLADELFFQSHGLLLESGIDNHEPQVFDYKGKKVFFSCGKQSALPFDPFSAGLYLVSRYEEYLPHQKDLYGRFDPKNSLAFQHGFLQQPVIDQWAGYIKEIITTHYPAFHFPAKAYQFVPTIDVDNAYAYLGKGIMRTLGAFTRSALRLDTLDIKRRSRAIFGIDRDPFDTFDYQLDIQKEFGFKPVYFFLVADYGLNDKNVPVTNRRFQSLIKHIADYADVGIHPSFLSNEDPPRLKKEVKRLSGILNRGIRKSRHHFLKLSIPHTYRQLLELEITDDYTMGYPSELGFRAGICSSFNFYDLEYENETPLRVHPFSVMEATLKYYHQLPPESAMEYIQPIIEEIKAVNGTFSFLWHNDSLSDQGDWKGWKKIYRQVVEMAAAAKP